jgi:drug/metabolite transporter (DMT)-like permease
MTQSIISSREATVASVAVAFCGAIWGVYWLPLRYLHELGLYGAWATAAFFIAALPPALFLCFLARREIAAQFRPFLWLAFLNGLVFNLYSNAYAGTSVFNVLFLFYLSPIWSILIARFWFGERVGLARIACVVAGLAGLVLMLSKDGGWPLPRNLADWMAIASGVLWAIVAIRVRKNAKVGAAANSVAFFLGGLALAVVFVLVLGRDQTPTPDAIGAAWPLVAAVAWLAWIPSQFLLFWGVRRISPVRTGILLMTELVSGVTTAAWLSGDPITFLQALGGALILAAGLGDVLTNCERRATAAVPIPVVQE